MIASGPVGDVQPISDLVVAQSIGNQTENVSWRAEIRVGACRQLGSRGEASTSVLVISACG